MTCSILWLNIRGRSKGILEIYSGCSFWAKLATLQPFAAEWLTPVWAAKPPAAEPHKAPFALNITSLSPSHRTTSHLWYSRPYHKCAHLLHLIATRLIPYSFSNFIFNITNYNIFEVYLISLVDNYKCDTWFYSPFNA